MLRHRWIPVLATLAALSACAGPDEASKATAAPAAPTSSTTAPPDQKRCEGKDADLTDPQYPAALAEDPGYGYHKTAKHDLDGDGVDETVHVIAQVEKGRSGYLWDDGHIWHVYVEEPSGERTYLYSGRVQIGLLEVALILRDEKVTDLLIEHDGASVFQLYCAQYHGPDAIRTTDVVGYDLRGQVEMDAEE